MYPMCAKIQERRKGGRERRREGGRERQKERAREREGERERDTDKETNVYTYLCAVIGSALPPGS